MAIQILDLTSKPHKDGKRLQYEVCTIEREAGLDDWREAEVVAKFRVYGDAMRWAQLLSEAPMYHYAVIVRS